MDGIVARQQSLKQMLLLIIFISLCGTALIIILVPEPYQYIWGAQLELNSSMNDYVATTSAASVRSTNIIDMIGGYNMSNSYGNNAYYINTTSSFMQFTRAAASPKDGGGATVGTSGSLTAANFLYNDHTWEIWFRLDNIQPGYSSYGNDPEEGYSALANYQGYHAGFQYTASVMYYYIWNGVATLPTCALLDCGHKWCTN
jgi:hypothetical protein